MSWYAKKNLCYAGSLIYAGEPVPAGVAEELLSHWHEQGAIAPSPVVEIPAGPVPSPPAPGEPPDPREEWIGQLQAELAAKAQECETFRLALGESQRRLVEQGDQIARGQQEVERLTGELAAKAQECTQFRAAVPTPETKPQEPAAPPAPEPTEPKPEAPAGPAGEQANTSRPGNPRGNR